LSTIIPQSNFHYLEQSGRKGNITWSQIDREPLALIHPRFILEAKIGDPTRMSVDDIKAYWGAWAKQSGGFPFSFLHIGERKDQDQEDQEEGGSKGQDGDEEDAHLMTKNKSYPSPIPGDIDIGIPLPCECDTPTVRTTCLQQLAPKWGSSMKSFHNLVGLVDELEVRPGWIT